MDADRSSSRGGLLEAETTGRIIPAFYEVYNSLGFGRLEQVYRNGLQVELSRRRVAWEKEVLFPVFHRGVKVGLYRCDLLVERRVIIEVEATYKLTDADHRQLLNYLRSAELEVGLLLHFGPTPSFHRVVASRGRFPPHAGELPAIEAPSSEQSAGSAGDRPHATERSAKPAMKQDDPEPKGPGSSLRWGPLPEIALEGPRPRDVPEPR